MAGKAKQSKKDNKNLIIGICAAIAVVAVIIITIVLVNNGSGLNDSYFVSDDTKYVLTIEADDSDDSDEYTPLKTHLVYTYDGDTITSMKSYYEYADANTAKAAYDAMKEAGGEEVEGMELNGKYIIMTAEEDVYKDLTTSDVKQQIEFMEMLKNMDSDDLYVTDDDEVVEVEDVEEDEE